MAQLPFVDMRPFAGERGERLSRPTWPAPAVGHEFVRRFGAVSPTPGGGLRPWDGEEYFCRADAAIGFQRSPTKEPGARLEVVHRRLFFNGRTGRVELAFRTPDRGNTADVARTVAELRVRVRGARPCAFFEAGSPLTRLLLSATTPVARRGEARKTRLIVAGMPLVLVERRGIRGEGLVFPMEDPDGGVLLEHVLTGPSEIPAALWAVSHGNASDKLAIKAVRTHAIRLHSEYEAFAAILRACLRKDIDPSASETLRDYLHTASRRMLRASFGGLPQAGVLAEMAKARAALAPGESDSLEAALQEIRPSLRRLVLDAAHLRADPVDGTENRTLHFNVITNNFSEGAIVTVNSNSNNISIGEGAQVQGVVGSGNTVTNSSFGDGGATRDRLGELVEQLIAQLEELGPRVEGGTEDQVELARAAQEELQRDEPKPGRVRGFLSSVLLGVKEVGQAAKPVIETVDAIQQLVQ
ncbi:MAG TPA: hypothetical protein VGL47_05595 [Amycolatopsis sp.]|uniref:hypothetical protein n=1 Tax=Amycolatopsis sp. TaxID=37632 RepID=UPI002F418D04